MQKRQPGIDLFRCMGLLFVTGLHAFLYNGFYSEIQSSPSLWGANCFRWLFSGCNGMFMLMTGYLKTRKPFCRDYYRGLWTVLAGYAVVCAVSFPVRYFLLGETDGWFTWLNRFLTFEGYAWYIEMYIGLMLLSPVLNLAMDQLREPKQLYWLAGTMFLLTALPTLTPLHLLPDYWTGLYPLTYYTLGAVIRRLEPKLPRRYGLIGAAATAVLMGTLSSLTASGGTFVDGFAQGGFSGCLTTVMITFLFLGVYRLPLGQKTARILAWLSDGVFEGYLLSRLLDVWVYDQFPFWHRPECYPLIFLFVTLPIFLFSAFAGKLAHRLSSELVRLMTRCATKRPIQK